jgi:hypothetical protein
MISAAPVIGSEISKSGMKRYFFVAMAPLVILTVFAGFASCCVPRWGCWERRYCA